MVGIEFDVKFFGFDVVYVDLCYFFEFFEVWLYDVFDEGEEIFFVLG